MITQFQAKYYSHQLLKRKASDDSEKLGTALIDAKVDLNPHQIEAALFAFNSPLSKGAILADEVGLGKTIEAGILLSQFWATDKKKLMVICPSNLRKQWSLELEEKFYLPTYIIESKNFNVRLKAGKHNPFETKKVVICSFHFARKMSEFIKLIDWDLVVIDEAHRLRNVYRPSNRIGKAIKDAVYPAKKVLLTATPLQNSLMELYGLVSLLDETVFGDVNTFRSQFTRVGDNLDYSDLRDRIAPVIKRSLRRQVQEYIRYTQRLPITITFEPTEKEKKLYDEVSAYLREELLYAIPNNQRHLLTLVVRKLLASSSYAIAATLETLIKRLEKSIENKETDYDLETALTLDLENLDELVEEWDDEIEDETAAVVSLEKKEEIKDEIARLRGFRNLALSIQHDAKGEKLIAAIHEGFEKLDELGANRKAIIFTESRRTQEYLFNVLQSNGFRDKVMLFNGANTDELSSQIYKSWVLRYEGTDRLAGSATADKRQALVDYFKEHAEIMIATEAAAEGINLQFCSMVINYDLPWNPQRIEQRIGRCHRYGQQHDVVVVNFLNTENEADQRVYQLLDQKLQLFSGIFGASDDVLGALESGVDFEKRIAAIYQSCRTTEQINRAFDDLQNELEEVIEKKLKDTQEKLFEHFDAEVVDKLRTRLSEVKAYLNKYEQWLWKVTQLFLQKIAMFDTGQLTFKLLKNPFKAAIKTGIYTLNKSSDQHLHYRINHPLAKGILKHYYQLKLPVSKVEFNLSSYNGNISSLEPLKGKSGWMTLQSVEVNSFEITDHLLFTAFTDDLHILSQEQCFRMMELDAKVVGKRLEIPSSDAIEGKKAETIQQLRIDLKNKDARYLQMEINKLNRWAEDRVYLVEKELKDTKQRIKELTRQASQISDPAEHLETQKKIREMEKRQRRQRQEIFDAEDQIKEQRDLMIGEIEKRMQRSIQQNHVFTISWSLV